MPGVSYTQGFNILSGRNHPELDWQVAETAHFRIMYPAHIVGIEVEAAAVAEKTYATLSTNLNVTFDRKIRIYLSDEDEIANGFAVPFGNGYANIWVHVNEAAAFKTGRSKWLRDVVAHELAHLFHYQATVTKPRFLSYLFGNPLPRFWTEGIAQYETELWDTQRGDRWLRTAVLDDRLSYQDGQSIWNGRLLYAIGNAQVRYLASRYGDSTLVKILVHRKRVFGGLAQVHDFNKAFYSVTGKSYRSFFDEWRRHVNVYYNTLAGQLETLEILDADTLVLPGHYFYDVRQSPDTTSVAVLSLVSTDRPVRRLYVYDRSTKRHRTVAEGSIKAPVAWSPDGKSIAFARTARGAHGSIVHDLFIVDADGKNMRRLTEGRRAASPVFEADGKHVVFIGSDGGTANVFSLDMESGQERPYTTFTGDVQILSLQKHPFENKYVIARFGADGTRALVLLDMPSGNLDPLTDGADDDRQPIWSPDGQKIAYTSFRDDVPNVFLYDDVTGIHKRVTHLASGATALTWLFPDSLAATGCLVIGSQITKIRDGVYCIDPEHVPDDITPHIPGSYSAWVNHRPPIEIPISVSPDASLISQRFAYSARKNLTHIASFLAPYYGGVSRFGIVGFTGWLEPLAKHILYAGGQFSFSSSFRQSHFIGSYINNQWYPTISFNLYHLPGSMRVYGEDMLVEGFTGGDLSVRWPLNRPDVPFVHTTFDARIRYVDIEPLNTDDFVSSDNLSPPEAGQQADLRFSITRKKLRPYRDSVVHPLDGSGARFRLTAATRLFGADRQFLRGEFSAFRIVPSLGLHRILVYGRLQFQTGRAFAQDFIGLSRNDDFQPGLPNTVPFTFGEAERVRGYRQYVLGNRLLFGTVEYRLPLLPDLKTRLLGLLSFGPTTLTAFSDIGWVWTGGELENRVHRLGIGVELKNALEIGGFFKLAHAIGMAQPASSIGTNDLYEVYYRIRSSLPF